MSLAQTQAWLLGEPGFRHDFARLQEEAVARQFPGLVRDEPIVQFVPNWPNLLFGASILAQGENSYAQEVALRIAQTALEHPGASQAERDGAAVVLDELGNRRAIGLAEERELLPAGIDRRLGIAAMVDWTRRGLEHSITLPGGAVLQATAFQRRFWAEAHGHGWLSASAPTSAGKSFIIMHWLMQELAGDEERTVVYVAPTRALIQQVDRDVRQLLRDRRISGVSTITVPFQERQFERPGSKVLIFTQERLHYFLRRHGSDIPIHALVVDEAHKIGDRHRGVLLQDVIEQTTRLNPAARVIFASPLVSNPAELLADAPDAVRKGTILSNDVTVNQNLLWLDHVKGTGGTWELSLCGERATVRLGELSVQQRAGSGQANMAQLAVACDTGGGTLVYVDTADAAEKVAAKLRNLLPEIDGSEALDDVAELAKAAVHKEYSLPSVLRHGVAFHYGNMPLVLRTEIEDLFRSGAIRYLVCTSTLVEGVNLPCRTLLVRAPKRGVHPMDAADFWNLAGRAGRWGKEFQGNIVCVQATDRSVWKGGPPRNRSRLLVERSTDRLLRKDERFLPFLRAGALPQGIAEEAELESMTSYLTSTALEYGSLSQSPWGGRIPPSELAPIEAQVAGLIAGLRIPRAFVSRHPGISPAAMSRLLDAFGEMDIAPETLLPVDSRDPDAAKRYSHIFDIIRHHLSPGFGSGRSSFGLALTTCEWMRGHPIARIVSEKMAWSHRQKIKKSNATVIRDTLRDIEEIARFQAPRALSCYIEILGLHLRATGRDDLAEGLPDLTLALEFGVDGSTQLALLSIGLSRSAALALTDLLRQDRGGEHGDDDLRGLPEQAVIEWFRGATLVNRGLARLIQREAEELRLVMVLANDS